MSVGVMFYLVLVGAMQTLTTPMDNSLFVIFIYANSSNVTVRSLLIPGMNPWNQPVSTNPIDIGFTLDMI